MHRNAKERIHEILDGAPGGDLLCKLVDACLLILIVGNVMAVILETVHSIYSTYAVFFEVSISSLCLFLPWSIYCGFGPAQSSPGSKRPFMAGCAMQ